MSIITIHIMTHYTILQYSHASVLAMNLTQEAFGESINKRKEKSERKQNRSSKKGEINKWSQVIMNADSVRKRKHSWFMHDWMKNPHNSRRL